MKTSALLVTALLFGAGAVEAQEYELTRRQFTFLDNHLTVEIVADMPGQLQIVRGEPGRIEVAARVPGGIPAFALGGREGDQLRITALGGENADFVIVIPEDASVRIKLPDRHSHQVKSLQRSGRYTWGEAAARSAAPAPGAAPMPAPRGPATAYSNELTPRIVNVPKLNSVRAVSVRFEGPVFTVGGTQVMSVQHGDPSNIVVRTGDEVQDVIITVPIGTSDFSLKLGGKTAMHVVGGEIRMYCEPVTEQQLPGGRRWYTFSPEMGRMTCR
jgi:hypothetical protein